MDSSGFSSNKKVWRPHFNRSPPIIDVVTNYRQKAGSKEEYALKISNIEMNKKPDLIYVENFSKISKTREKSNIHFVEWSKNQRNQENGKNRNENLINISTFSQHVCNEITLNEQFSKQIITVKKENKIARKVYLKWSKYTSTHQVDDKNIELDLSELKKENYLQKKYWNLWRERIFGKRTIKNVKVESGLKINQKTKKIMNRRNSEDNLICSFKPQKPKIYKRNSEYDLLKSKTNKSMYEMQKQKIEEQENLIKELQFRHFNPIKK